MAETEEHRGLVREAALDRIASQERLDVLIDVTTPPYWIALTTIGGLLLAAVLWGIFGSLPVRVSGEGILTQGELRVLVASEPGMIDRVLVSPRETVNIEEPVVRLNHNQILRDLGQCQREAEFAKPGTEEAIQGLSRQLVSLQERQRNVEALLRKGLMTRRGLLDIEGEITATTAEIQARRQKIRTLEAECQDLKRMAETDAVIRSVVNGRVIDITVREGDKIQTGTQILTLETPGRLEATIFIPARDGERIKVGMPALLSPSHIRPEEEGYLIARVSSCTKYPATPESLKEVLRNETLVQRLLEQGPLYRIGLRLEEDKGSPNGFRWKGKGSKMPIDSGTVASASIVVGRRRPISYVVPVLQLSIEE